MLWGVGSGGYDGVGGVGGYNRGYVGGLGYESYGWGREWAKEGKEEDTEDGQ